MQPIDPALAKRILKMCQKREKWHLETCFLMLITGKQTFYESAWIILYKAMDRMGSVGRIRVGEGSMLVTSWV
jgi:hypothetical protein